jgi:uncharacterized repeat protein (TIGR03803 family)
MTQVMMTRIKNYRMSAIALLALTVVAAATPAYAQTYSVIYNFGNRTGDPMYPAGVIAQGRDGALYTTSAFGGSATGEGAVFKIGLSGQLEVLYSFCSQANCADGEEPFGGLTLRPDDHFLGSTKMGAGTSCESQIGCGTVFDISPTGTLTTLYTFTDGTAGGNPSGPPILGPDGSFYGVASNGNPPSSCGTLYKITPGSAASPPTAVFTLLHRFDRIHGCNPNGPLVLGTDGNFYGTTGTNAAGEEGVFFRLSVPPHKAPVVTVLANFNGESLPNPNGPLIQGSDGNFYGTTWYPQSGEGGGMIFRISPTGTLTVVHTLNGTTDGLWPLSLVQATDGNFYGVAADGGTSSNSNCANGGCGTLFQITPTGSYSVLYNFDFTTGNPNPYGTYPGATQVQHTNGQLYGDIFFGGTSGNADCIPNGCGVFYSWDASLPPFVSTVPFMGKAGSFVEILGQGFDSTTSVSFNGTPATATVVSGTYLKATVPPGATSGFVTVTTSNGTLTSNKQFIVTQ